MRSSRSKARLRNRRARLDHVGHRVFLLAALGAILLPPGVAAQAWNTVEGLDRYISAAQEAWGVPGMAVAVIRDGDVVLARGYGRRSLDEPGEVDEHTLFAIASNSKAFTSASLATLVEEGRLGWDDRVQDHLPWFQVYDAWVSSEMRIRDLLSHRSGLGTYSGDLLWYGTGYSAEEVIRRVRHLPPSGSFRASYGYSNLMFITAGLVIEAVTGQAWANVIQDRFLEPLGMDRTVTSVADLGGMANVASPHSDRGGSLRTFAWYGWDNMAAAGGIISSVSDMSRWMRMQLAEGEFEGRRYFSPQAAHVMWTPHNSFAVVTSARERYPSTHFRGYGLGWSLMDYRGHLVASHGGGYDGMFSRVVLVPEADLGVVVLTNSMTVVPLGVGENLGDAPASAPVPVRRDVWRSALRRCHGSGRGRRARPRPAAQSGPGWGSHPLAPRYVQGALAHRLLLVRRRPGALRPGSFGCHRRDEDRRAERRLLVPRVGAEASGSLTPARERQPASRGTTGANSRSRAVRRRAARTFRSSAERVSAPKVT